jgi:hypothetical protein
MACGQEPASVTAIPLGRRLPGASSNLPGRPGLDIDPGILFSACARTAPHRPYSVLLPVGFALPSALPPPRCALTAPFHPYRGLLRNAPRRFDFCGTFPGLAPAGCYPAPLVHGARTFLPGRARQSGPLAQARCEVTGAAVRPTDDDRDGGLGRRRQGEARRSKARARVANFCAGPRRASSSFNVLRVEASAMPSTRSGRKCRWNAVTT